MTGTSDIFTSSPAFQDWMLLINLLSEGLRKTGITELGQSQNTDILLRKLTEIVKTKMDSMFEIIGTGSSRTVFRFVKDGKFVLKFAKNSGGLIQNRQEVQNIQAKNGYTCFAQVYNFDSVNFICVVSDYCSESTIKDWIRITGLDISTVLDIIDYAISRKRSLKEIERQCGLGWNDMDRQFVSRFKPTEIEAIRLFCRNALNQGSSKWTSFRDIIRFYFDKGQHTMLISDLGGYANWGVRRGSSPEQDALVIIDSGIA